MGFFFCVFKFLLSLGIMIFVGICVDRAFKKRECTGKKKPCKKKCEEEEEEIEKSEKRAAFKNMMKNVEDDEEEEEGENPDLKSPPMEADRHKKWMEEMKVYNVDQPKGASPNRVKELMAKKQQLKKPEDGNVDEPPAVEEEAKVEEAKPLIFLDDDDDDDSDDGVDGKDAISSFMDQMLDGDL